MAQYLISLYQPDGEPPAPDVLGPIMADLESVRRDMQAAGVWVFSGGLHPPGAATVLRVKGEETLISDGPYLEGTEHLGGFTVVDVPDLDAALDWGGRMARAVRLLPVEVRPLASSAG
jgi:hypothetical protein